MVGELDFEGRKIFAQRFVYFAAFKNHIGFFIPTPVVEEHKNELKGYVTSKATVRFPLDKKLPVALIWKLVKARMKRNEAGRENYYNNF